MIYLSLTTEWIKTMKKYMYHGTLRKHYFIKNIIIYQELIQNILAI